MQFWDVANSNTWVPCPTSHVLPSFAWSLPSHHRSVPKPLFRSIKAQWTQVDSNRSMQRVLMPPKLLWYVSLILVRLFCMKRCHLWMTMYDYDSIDCIYSQLTLQELRKSYGPQQPRSHPRCSARCLRHYIRPKANSLDLILPSLQMTRSRRIQNPTTWAFHITIHWVFYDKKYTGSSMEKLRTATNECTTLRDKLSSSTLVSVGFPKLDLSLWGQCRYFH